VSKVNNFDREVKGICGKEWESEKTKTAKAEYNLKANPIISIDNKKKEWNRQLFPAGFVN